MKKFSPILIILCLATFLPIQLIQAQSMDQYGHVQTEQFTSAIQQTLTPNQKLNSDWISLGPDGGDVLDLCVDPLNINRVFAAAGIPYISEDGGDNWAVLDALSSLASGIITSIDINGDGVAIAGGLYNYGKLYRSADEGLTWSTKSFPLSTAYALDITFDPSNLDNVYVALSANGTSSNVLLKSTDAGASWSVIDLISVMPTGWSLVNIVVDPANNQSLYAIGNESFSNAMVIASFDGGTSWENISGNLPTGRPYNRLAVADGVVYMAGGQLFGGQSLGIYKTEDNGGSWVNISSSFPVNVANDILIDPTYEDILYAATEGDGVYYTTDGGANWNFDGTGAGESGSVRILAFEPGNSQTIYAGLLSLAVIKSTDVALNWEYANKGIATLQLNDIEVNTNDPDKMLVGFEGENSGGCYLSNDGGLTWELVTSLPATRFSQVAYGADGSMYAWSNGPTTVAAEGLYKSSDEGANWDNTGPNIGSVFETQIFTLIASPSDPDLLLIGGNNFGANGWESMIYRTSDGGDIWDNTFQGPANDSFKFLSIDQNSSDQFVYAAYKSDGQGGFLKSLDGGIYWLPILNGIPASAHWCSAITVDPGNSNILYGGVGGYGGMAGSIYRSENAGNTWEFANLSLASNYSKITEIMVSPENSVVIYAATTSDGVYMSSDTATSWNKSNENLAATNISGFSNPFLNVDVWQFCASTLTNSAFITDIFIPGGVGIYSENRESQPFIVYPNPSNGKFTIEMDNALWGPSEIKIYNKQGQAVYESIFESMLDIDIDLPAGIWFLRINSRGKSYVEKIVIL